MRDSGVRCNKKCIARSVGCVPHGVDVVTLVVSGELKHQPDGIAGAKRGLVVDQRELYMNIGGGILGQGNGCTGQPDKHCQEINKLTQTNRSSLFEGGSSPTV